MPLKPIIFIGSSSEALPIAKQIKKKLDAVAKCELWPNVFELGTSAYDQLISIIPFYDYVILIATADDVVVSRRKKTAAPRDNVLFEFGLFAGGLGKNKVFYIAEENAKFPSDLNGITLPRIPAKTERGFTAKLDLCLKKIKTHIKRKEKTFDFGFIPSTALAYGYFYNFVERTVERLLEDKQDKKTFHFSKGKPFSIKKLKFTILIPDDLTDNMFKKVKAKRLNEGWQKLKVDPRDIRDYDFSVDIKNADKGLFHLVDIPFTLNAMNKVIELYAQKASLGKSARENILEQREINNFKRTLEYLISSSSLAKNIVTVEIVNI